RENSSDLSLEKIFGKRSPTGGVVSSYHRRSGKGVLRLRSTFDSRILSPAWTAPAALHVRPLLRLCLIPLIYGSGFNRGSGGLEAVDEISNRSMMISA
ncbi:hypothetical protein HID58_034471, partial [Brassica napus]